MAEERIFVAKLGGRNCPLETNDNICLQGSCCEKCNAGITRQDAIEIIAEYLCRKDYGIKSCHECTYNGTVNCGYTLNEWFSEDAEAALNALLEGQNDKENN